MLWVAIVTIMGLNKNNQGSSADRLLFVKLRLSHIFKVLMRATPVQKCAVNVTLGNLQQETGPSPVMPVVLVPSLTHQVRTAPGEVIIRIRSLIFEQSRRINQEISRSNQETCSRQHLLLLLHSGPLRWQHQLNVLHVM